MHRYIGLDAHMESCTFAVMGQQGRRLQQQVIATEAGALTSFLKGINGSKHLCMEEGTYSEWLFEVLSPVVNKIVVVQPTKRQPNKNDSVDAWDLADRLRTKRLTHPVYKETGEMTQLRQAVRTHHEIVRDMVRVKNRLRTLYRSRGVWGMGDAIYHATKRQQWLDKLPAAYRRHAELISSELDGLKELHADAERWLKQEAKAVWITDYIETAPGISTIRAAQIVATIVTPHRFRTKRQLWAYSGLAVVTGTSSDWAQDRRGAWQRKPVIKTYGLNHNRNPLLKQVFKGAAQTVITQMPTHPLHLNYQRLLNEGTKPNLAALTIARQIAAAILAMWKRKEIYDPEKHRKEITI